MKIANDATWRMIPVRFRARLQVMSPVTLVGNMSRGILPARLKIFLLVKLYAILRARLQVMVRARWRCAASPCNVRHKITCKLVSDTKRYAMRNIACEVASGATCNFTRHTACNIARITMCNCMCKYCVQGGNYCYMFFNVKRNIAYKVASAATPDVTTAKTRHISFIKTTVASSGLENSFAFVFIDC